MNSNELHGTCKLLMETHEEFIRLRMGIERLMLPVAQSYGLTTTQIAVLNLIRKLGKATVSTLFKSLDFNQGNMSSLCKKLENDGYIKKEKCHDDERKSYLTLTEKSFSVLESIDRLFSFTEEECWLDPDEYNAAENALSVLKETAKKINALLSASTDERNEN